MHRKIARSLLFQKHYGFQLNIPFLAGIFNDFHRKICGFHRKPKMFLVFSQFMVLGSCSKKFSMSLHSIYLIFFLFERACQDARDDVLLLLVTLVFCYIFRHLYTKPPIFRHFLETFNL